MFNAYLWQNVICLLFNVFDQADGVCYFFFKLGQVGIKQRRRYEMVMLGLYICSLV